MIAPQQGGTCDEHPLRRVYAPSRLKVVDKCAEVTVTVRTARKEQDGDWHVNVDPDSKAWINAANRRRQHGQLVVEFAPGDPKPDGFEQGQRLHLTCTKVRDVQHASWLECHPVFAVSEVAPGSAPAPLAKPIPGERPR